MEGSNVGMGGLVAVMLLIPHNKLPAGTELMVDQQRAARLVEESIAEYVIAGARGVSSAKGAKAQSGRK